MCIRCVDCFHNFDFLKPTLERIASKRAIQDNNDPHGIGPFGTKPDHGILRTTWHYKGAMPDSMEQYRTLSDFDV